jgi:choline-sulfatase
MAAPGVPNVVWVCADDFNPSVCGAYGGRARTPNLDRLAAAGVRFDRAYCTCPLSTPSRQSFWTGRYPRSIGVTLSPTPLPDDEVTLPARLRALDYETAAFGKTHFYAPRRHEFDECLDWDDFHLAVAPSSGPVPAGTPVLGPWRPSWDPPHVWLNAGVLPYGAYDKDMAGTFFARHAARFLRQPRRRPFFLYVSFLETHSPFWFPVDFPARHDPASFPLPALTADDLAALPPVFRTLTAAHKQGILAAYHTSAEFLDKNVGLVLDALNGSGHSDNTLVIFTSDHGYLLGEHGRFEKHCCYEPAIRAALLVRRPGHVRQGRSSDALVQLFDLAPTVVEAAGGTVPARMQARSLLPLLHGEMATHREEIFVEYADNEEAMVATGRWKLIYSTGKRRRQDGYYLGGTLPGRMVQLFDHEADPGETVNLAGRREYADVAGELLQRLADHVRRTARDPRGLPAGDDPLAVLDAGLAPAEE